MAVTVDLPLVPLTAMVRWVATYRASNSERCRMATPPPLAAFTSGTLFSTAVLTTTASGRRPAKGPSFSRRKVPSWSNRRTPSWMS